LKRSRLSPLRLKEALISIRMLISLHFGVGDFIETGQKYFENAISMTISTTN